VASAASYEPPLRHALEYEDGMRAESFTNSMRVLLTRLAAEVYVVDTEEERENLGRRRGRRNSVS
jgi:hypothetical protein